MNTILITGGTGLIGSRMSDLLAQKGYQVRHLSRTENLNATYPAYHWDIQAQTIDPRALDGVDGIVHLAGAGIADKRWTPERKRIIRDSRVLSAELLSKAIAESAYKPSVFVSGSAIGYYGDQGDRKLVETSPPGKDFMSEICIQWERASDSIQAQGIRRPIIRTGVVLSTQGGALQKINMSYGFRVGAYFGDGRQYMPWIHLDDICGIFIRALEDERLTEVYNGTAPEPVTNKTLAQALSAAHDQSTLLVPVPTPALRLAMGEMADAVLNSTRAIPQALLDLEHVYEHPNLVSALEHLLKRDL